MTLWKLNLPAGVHSTNLQLRLCEDDPQVCHTPLPGSPWYVPLKVTVKSKAESAARLSLSVESLDLVTYAGEALSFSIDAKVSGDLVGQKYNVAAIDPAGLTVAARRIGANGQTINAAFNSVSSLPHGTYTSNLEIRLCRDEPESCKQPLAGSPWIVPLKLTVLSGVNLSSLKAIPGLKSWSTYQGNAAHTGYVPASFDVINSPTRGVFIFRATNWAIRTTRTLADEIMPLLVELPLNFAVTQVHDHSPQVPGNSASLPAGHKNDEPCMS